jgi:putative ABC transport system permease protein
MRPTALGAYRALLRLFPSSFRVEFGAEMGADFAARLAATRGARAGALLWVDALLDVVHNAARVHADVLRQDLRFTVRTLRRSPGFTATAVLLAALGVAATTATFSVADHVLVRPLPFRDPDRLVKVWESDPEHGVGRNEVSPAHFRDWRRLSRSFEAMANLHFESVNLVGAGEPQRLDGAAISAGMLPLLGRPPALGRGFTEADDRAGATGTLLLGHRLWQTRFGGDPGVLGRKVLLDDEPFEVIGVMPADFRFPTAGVELWIPNRFGPDAYEERGDTYIQVVGRLRRGASLEQARAEMRAIDAQLARSFPEDKDLHASVLDLRGELPRQSRLLLGALCGAALCMLLVACTNLASLLITRALARRRELAVRTALGGGRERLLRQLITESVVLAAIGGALGVAGAAAAVPMLSRLVPAALPFPAEASLDLRVLGFTALLTAVTGVVFGVLPAARACMRVDATDLREGARGGIGDRRERLRSALVVAEVTATVVLLVCSGLLVRALARLGGVDPGFRSAGVLALRTDLPLPRYEATARRVAFYRRVLGEVRTLPGVDAAAYVTALPMERKGGIWGIGLPDRPEDPERRASLRYVSPGFFATMGIPLDRGRDVGEGDTAEALPVAVVSRSFLEQCWPGEREPLGRTFHFANQDRSIVGIVGDVRVRGLEQDSEPQVYLSYQQVPDGAIIGYVPRELVMRSTEPAGRLAAAVRAIVGRADPRQPISDLRPVGDVVAAETAPRALQARVLGAFALLAFLLAGIGLHGLLAYSVSARAPELGVRVALGADRREILGLVLRRGVQLAAAGVLAGAVLAYGAGRSLQALLAGVSPHDPLTYATAVGLSLVMALAGSLLPALRATRLDPLVVMRTE